MPFFFYAADILSAALFFADAAYIKSMKKTVSWFCLAVVACFIVFAPRYLRAEDKIDEGAVSTVLVMWHVDTFEGGTGSRQDFLMKSAVEFEKQNNGVLVSVIKHTEESVHENFSRGILPDMISFGVGVYDVVNYAKPLKTRINNAFFASVESGGGVFCYPYAFGRYVKLSIEGSKGEGVIVSKGKNNLPLFMSGLVNDGKVSVFEPLEAYSRLLSGKYASMIGTQRDVYRLTSRGVQFTCLQASVKTDLVQYVAVTAVDGARAELAASFASYLLTDAVQKRLNEIGLFSPVGVPVDYGIEAMNELEEDPPSGVLSALLDGQKHRELVQNDGKNDFFEKFENYMRY